MKILVKYVLSLFLISSFPVSLMSQSDNMMQPQTSESDLTEQEFEQFAETMLTVGTLQQEMQGEMIHVINEAGMETNRFNELAQAKFDPDKEVEANKEEMATFEQVLGLIQSMQTEMQTAITEKIQEKGFSMQRYQEVAGIINTDPEWQQRLQEYIEENNN